MMSVSHVLVMRYEFLSSIQCLPNVAHNAAVVHEYVLENCTMQQSSRLFFAGIQWVPTNVRNALELWLGVDSSCVHPGREADTFSKWLPGFALQSNKLFPLTHSPPLHKDVLLMSIPGVLPTSHPLATHTAVHSRYASPCVGGTHGGIIKEEMLCVGQHWSRYPSTTPPQAWWTTWSWSTA